MKDLEILDLYEKVNKENTTNFIGKIDSNLRVRTQVKKTIKDIEWIEKMEETIPYIDNILRAPNRFIVNDEEIVKIELARKITVDSIKHLSKNTNLIQSVDKETGDVKPSKILNINKDETYDTYENRLIYTLIQNMKVFINSRKSTLNEELDSETRDDKKIDYTGTSKTINEKIGINLSLNSTLDYGDGKSPNDTADLLKRIEKLEKDITNLENTEVYKTLDKLHVTLVRESIKKTNVILKNVNFQYAMKLWNYLRDNFEDKTMQIDEEKDYIDKGDLKNLLDEIFMLQYIAMKTIDEDKMENEEVQEEVKEAMIEQMINKMLDLDVELTISKLKQMITNNYEAIRYKKLEVLREIQKIYKEHINKYLKKVEKNPQRERNKKKNG